MGVLHQAGMYALADISPAKSKAVALPICPPRKQQPGHIVRGLPTPAYLSSGEDAADDQMHTLSYLLLL